MPVFHQMVLDARAKAAGPGGHLGAAMGSSAAGLHSAAGTSESHFPDPPPATRPLPGRPVPQVVSRPAPRRDRSRCQAPLCLTAARTGTHLRGGNDPS
jgi:hypothetical protein